MDVIVRSNNNPVNDMTAPVSWLINDLDKAIKTKRLRVLFICAWFGLVIALLMVFLKNALMCI